MFALWNGRHQPTTAKGCLAGCGTVIVFHLLLLFSSFLVYTSDAYPGSAQQQVLYYRKEPLEFMQPSPPSSTW